MRITAAITLALLASPALAGDIEDFEHGNPGLYSLSSGTTHNMLTTASAAHDGALGAEFGSGSTPWMIRTDVTSQPGKSYFVYARLTGSGRIYVGYGATAAGAISVVAAPNTSELLIQRNTGWGYTDIATAPFTYQYGIWYLMELEWASNGDMTARLWDETGTTKLVETPLVATGRTTSGGIALRAFGGSPSQDIDTITDGAGFEGTPDSISLTTGGAQVLSLDIGTNFASQTYWILGSLTGSVPGIPYGPWNVPLNIDAYTLYTLNNPNTPLLNGSFGLLNSLGQATTVLTIPPASDPALAGIIANHAAIVFDPLAPGVPLTFVSEAVTCTLNP